LDNALLANIGAETFVLLVRPVKTASVINDSEHWRERARLMRLLAPLVQDKQARETMLQVAADYERLALRAAQRLNGESDQTDPAAV
jgi:predicted kinase